jgi:predicted house-cleaning noncanonical NTP pyrophosphatase (MazG superfamily)
MERNIPEKLVNFFKNALKDVDDGYEYASELNRILRSDECQKVFTEKELEILREFADKVKKVGEITCYTEERIKEIEAEHFGKRGVLGYLGAPHEDKSKKTKPQWPF